MTELQYFVLNDIQTSQNDCFKCSYESSYHQIIGQVQNAQYKQSNYNLSQKCQVKCEINLVNDDEFDIIQLQQQLEQAIQRIIINQNYQSNIIKYHFTIMKFNNANNYVFQQILPILLNIISYLNQQLGIYMLDSFSSVLVVKKEDAVIIDPSYKDFQQSQIQLIISYLNNKKSLNYFQINAEKDLNDTELVSLIQTGISGCKEINNHISKAIQNK